MARERSVKPPEHPAMRTARLVSLDGDMVGVEDYQCVGNRSEQKKY
jgi:hypothetical protein